MIPDAELRPILLSDEERRWLVELPINLALQKIIKGHWQERCFTCGSFIGNHSIKKAKKCVVTQQDKEKMEHAKALADALLGGATQHG
jgi:hypothetical protein